MPEPDPDAMRWEYWRIEVPEDAEIDVHREWLLVHSRATPPHVSPLPKATLTMRCPGSSRPAAAASWMASGMDAALVLPTRSTLRITLSMETPSRLAVASMIRRLAWWGTKCATSSSPHPASAHRSCTSSIFQARNSLLIAMHRIRLATT